MAETKDTGLEGIWESWCREVDRQYERTDQMIPSDADISQRAPYPNALQKLVDKLKYREGWSFRLSWMDRGQGSKGLTLRIQILAVDTYDPEKEIRVNHLMLVPPAAFNEASWRRWLLDQILLVERHEACEFFQIDGQRPYAPHHGFGEDPYIIWDRGTDQDARTSYLNERRETDDPKGGDQQTMNMPTERTPRIPTGASSFNGQGSAGAIKQME